jgi:hypothetical protein
LVCRAPCFLIGKVADSIGESIGFLDVISLGSRSKAYIMLESYKMMMAVTLVERIVDKFCVMHMMSHIHYDRTHGRSMK